jgi:hypothetical protein
VKPGGAQPATDGGKTQAGGNGSGVGILVNAAESRQGTSTDSLRTHRQNSHEENKHGTSEADCPRGFQEHKNEVKKARKSELDKIGTQPKTT